MVIFLNVSQVHTPEKFLKSNLPNYAVPTGILGIPIDTTYYITTLYMNRSKSGEVHSSANSCRVITTVKTLRRGAERHCRAVQHCQVSGDL